MSTTEPFQPTRDEFANLFIDSARERGDLSSFCYEPAKFALVRKGPQEQALDISLAAVYHDYLQAPESHKKVVLDDFLRACFRHDVPADLEDLACDLLPSLQPLVRLGSTNHSVTNKQPEHGEGLFRVIAEHLAVELVYDFPESKRYLTPEELGKWGLSADEAFEIALNNLSALAHQFGRISDGVAAFESRSDDSYDSTRLLLPELFSELPIVGSPIAMVPHPNALLVAGDRDSDGLRAILGRAEEFLQKPRSSGGFAFRLHNDTWRPWMPDRSHPLFEDFRLLANRTLAKYYGHQRTFLVTDDVAMLTKDGLFVASFRILESDCLGSVKTLSVWTQHAPSLLPKTDAIAFVKDMQHRGLVPWSVVARTMRDEMEPMGLYPERYRVLCFPTEGQLSSMIREARKRGVPQDGCTGRATPS